LPQFRQKRQSQKADLFLFVVDNRSLTGPSPGPTPVITQDRKGIVSGSIVSGSWTSGNKTYILAGLGDEDFLKQYFN